MIRKNLSSLNLIRVTPGTYLVALRGAVAAGESRVARVVHLITEHVTHSIPFPHFAHLLATGVDGRGREGALRKMALCRR